MLVRILLNLTLAASLSVGLSSAGQAKAPLSSSVPVQKPAEMAIEHALPLILQTPPSPKPDFIQTLIETENTVSIKPVRKPDTFEFVMGRRMSNAARQCRNDALVGEPIDSIKGKIKGCGVKDPVRLTAVHGIQLSRGAIMDCTTANAFAEWTEQSVMKEFKKKRREVVVMDVLASYQCRTRNNKPGAKISEHGKGRAVDIGSFLLDNGKRVSVFVDWNSKEWSKTMRAIHKGACKSFKTVLGPKADQYHKDHFHMDTAQRNSSYCR